MADHTGIEWSDATWNPCVGCSRVSGGCTNCYPIPWIHNRLSNNPNAKIRMVYEGLTVRHPNGNLDWSGEVRLIPERLEIPLHWKKPRRIFVNSMSDLFHEKLTDTDIASVLVVCALACHHTYQILTKRPARMREFLNRYSLSDCMDMAVESGAPIPMGREISKSITLAMRSIARDPSTFPDYFPMPHIWFGVSVEDQKTAESRIPLLLQTPAVVRFTSYEPALGPVDFTRLRSPGVTWLDCLEGREHIGLGIASGGPHLNLVIAGGESGNGARPAHPDWFRSARDQCQAAGVPFFFKQAGSALARQWALSDGKGGKITELPLDLQVREFPDELPA